MNRRGLSQEALKIIACVAMLIDHVAAVFVRDYGFTVLLLGIGRLAFPIYCFLMAEGAHYTRSPGKYALRLFVGALLSELPFDFALFGGFTWHDQSVMVTLLLGYGALWCMGRMDGLLKKCLIAIPFILCGELLFTDYGSDGVLLIALMGLVRDLPRGRWLQYAAIVLMCARIPSFTVHLGPVSFALEMVGILSIVPIALYTGRKQSSSPALQWGFYLFYPLHLALLAVARWIA